MSSIENNISSVDFEMIRSVLDDAGYDASVLVEDQCLFDTAALLVTKLFLSGVNSRSALAAKLECQLGRAGTHRHRLSLSLSRYAIQGFPLRVTGEQVISGAILRLFDCQRVLACLIEPRFIGRLWK